jgi:hypothetical protein
VGFISSSCGDGDERGDVFWGGTLGSGSFLGGASPNASSLLLRITSIADGILWVCFNLVILQMNLIEAAVVATVTSLFVLSLTVSKYFVIAAVGTLILVLFATPIHQAIVELHGAEASTPISTSVTITTPSKAKESRGEVATGVSYESRSLPTMERVLDGEDSEEAQALYRIEQAREAFQHLDDDDAVKWGDGQSELIDSYRLNNMGDDENTVTYLHPDYVNKYAPKEMDPWSEDMDRLRHDRVHNDFDLDYSQEAV